MPALEEHPPGLPLVELRLEPGIAPEPESEPESGTGAGPEPLRLPLPTAAADDFDNDDAAAFEELLAATRQGSDPAARGLVERMYPVVIRIVRSHLPARCEEEDVAQEVFLKMFSRLHQYRGPNPFSHWVSRIATNTCIDLLRRQKVRPEIRFADLTVAEEIMLQAAAQQEGEEFPGRRAEGSELVEKLLGSLKPDQQMVVRLLDVERQSVREICSRTGWSAPKVKMTALRARRKLAEVLGRLGKTFLS